MKLIKLISWIFFKYIFLIIVTTYVLIFWFYVHWKYILQNDETTCMIEYLNSDKLWIEDWLTVELWWTNDLWRHIWFWTDMNFLNQQKTKIIAKTDLNYKKWDKFSFCYLFDYDKLQQWKHTINLISTTQCFLYYFFEEISKV